MKVIFLDFDGVLNDIKYLINFKREPGILELDPKKMYKLFEIVEKTHAKIVLTSSWRFNPEIDDYFKKFNLKIYDRVTVLNNRSQEIDEWLSRNKVENYLILDDESSFYTDEQMSHAIITMECYSQEVRKSRDCFEGLQDKHVLWAIAMLNS